MCPACYDWVDACAEDGCAGMDRGIFTKAKNFYTGDRYCRHLEEEYGHKYAELSDRYDDED